MTSGYGGGAVAGAGGSWSRLLTGQGLNVVVGADGALGERVANGLSNEEVRSVYLGREGYERGTGEKSFVSLKRPAEVASACAGAATIYLCHQPGHSDPKEAWSELISDAILAAIDQSATLVFASHLIRTESENAAKEKEVLEVNSSGLARSVVVRLPQLFGPGAVNPLWRLIYDEVISGKKAHWVGDLDVPRSLLDVRDAARALVLLGRSETSVGKTWAPAGPGPISGRRFIELAFDSVQLRPNVGVWGRGVVMTGSLLAGSTRGILDMPYDYYSPFVLDGGEFAASYPDFGFVDAASSVRDGLEWYKENGTE